MGPWTLAAAAAAALRRQVSRKPDDSAAPSVAAAPSYGPGSQSPAAAAAAGGGAAAKAEAPAVSIRGLSVSTTAARLGEEGGAPQGGPSRGPSEAKRYWRGCVGGVNVTFPFTPYDSQQQLMLKTVEAALRAEHALLESPTGSGKTLCLLCAALAVQQQQQQLMQKQLLRRTPPSSLNSIPAAAGLQQTPHQQQQLLLLQRLQHQQAGPAVGKIVYASRTHSQLQHVIAELRKTPYAAPRPPDSILQQQQQQQQKQQQQSGQDRKRAPSVIGWSSLAPTSSSASSTPPSNAAAAAAGGGGQVKAEESATAAAAAGGGGGGGFAARGGSSSVSEAAAAPLMVKSEPSSTSTTAAAGAAAAGAAEKKQGIVSPATLPASGAAPPAVSAAAASSAAAAAAAAGGMHALRLTCGFFSGYQRSRDALFSVLDAEGPLDIEDLRTLSLTVTQHHRSAAGRIEDFLLPFLLLNVSPPTRPCASFMRGMMSLMHAPAAVAFDASVSHPPPTSCCTSLLLPGPQSFCPYYLMREQQTRSDVVLLPYNYLFDGGGENASLLAVDTLNNALLVVDEAHNIERQIHCCVCCCSLLLRVAEDASCVSLRQVDVGRCLLALQEAAALLCVDEGDQGDAEMPLPSPESPAALAAGAAARTTTLIAAAALLVTSISAALLAAAIAAAFWCCCSRPLSFCCCFYISAIELDPSTPQLSTPHRLLPLAEFAPAIRTLQGGPSMGAPSATGWGALRKLPQGGNSSNLSPGVEGFFGFDNKETLKQTLDRSAHTAACCSPKRQQQGRQQQQHLLLQQ
ncbi:hypothetical protein Emed_003596 [Eimeria media]